MTTATRSVVITGAAGFIGNAVAEALLTDGHAVVATDIGFDQARTSKMASANPRYRRHLLDVSDEDGWRDVAADLLKRGSTVSGLVTVAAINRVGSVTDYDSADWDAMMAVNVRGVFYGAKHLVPLMRSAGGGSIVNMSSVSAFIGARGGSAYHTTKGAVLSLSRALALELADDSIRVNCVCPGWVDTPFTDRSLSTLPDPAGAQARVTELHALGRMARAEDVAYAVCYLISGKAAFVTGTELVVDGGFMIRKE